MSKSNSNYDVDEFDMDEFTDSDPPPTTTKQSTKPKEEEDKIATSNAALKSATHDAPLSIDSESESSSDDDDAVPVIAASKSAAKPATPSSKKNPTTRVESNNDVLKLDEDDETEAPIIHQTKADDKKSKPSSYDDFGFDDSSMPEDTDEVASPKNKPPTSSDDATAAAPSSSEAKPCDLCSAEPSAILCSVCADSGMGDGFCLECSEQLHSSAKGKLHKLTDLNGKPIGGGDAQVEQTPSNIDHLTTKEETPKATTPKSTQSASSTKRPEPVVIPAATSSSTNVTEIQQPTASDELDAALSVDSDSESDASDDAKTDDKPPTTSSSDVPASSPFSNLSSPASDDPTGSPISHVSFPTHTRTLSPSSTEANSVLDHFTEQKRARAADPTRRSSASPFAKPTSSPSLPTNDAFQRALSPTQPHRDLCHSCEDSMVARHCHDCVRDYCESCDQQIHVTRELKKHKREPVSATVNMHVQQQLLANGQTSPANEIFPTQPTELYDSSPSSTPSVSRLSSEMKRTSIGPGSSTLALDKISEDAIMTNPRTESSTPENKQPELATKASVSRMQSTSKKPIRVENSDEEDEYKDSSDEEKDDHETTNAKASTAEARRSSEQRSEPVVESNAESSETAEESAPTNSDSAAASDAEEDEQQEDEEDYDEDGFDASASAVLSKTSKTPLPTVKPSDTPSPSHSQQPPTSSDQKAESADYEYSEDGFEESAANLSNKVAASKPKEEQKDNSSSSPTPAAASPSSKSPSNKHQSKSGHRTIGSTGSMNGASSKPSHRSTESNGSSNGVPAPISKKPAIPIQPRRKSKSPAKTNGHHSKSKPKTVSPAANKGKQSQQGQVDEEDDYEEDDVFPDADVDDTNYTVLEHILPVLLQDPLAPTTVQPTLEGMILPVTVIFRSGRASSVYYTDTTGYVRYHAWHVGRERQAESRVMSRRNSPTREHHHPPPPPLTLPGREGLSPIRARNSAQAAPFLHAFSPHVNAAMTPSTTTTGATLHSKTSEASAIDQVDVLRMFTPQLRSLQKSFLRKQTHKRKAKQKKGEEQKENMVPANLTTPAKKKPDDEENYEDDEEEYADDTEPSTTTAPSKSTAAAAAVIEQQYTDAYNRARAHRGYINIEDWKREQRMLMMARQKALHALAEQEKRQREEQECLQAIAQEKMYVAMLVYTSGTTHKTMSRPLPPPQALTLGQVRKLFRAPILSPNDLPAQPTTLQLQSYDFLIQKLEFSPGAAQTVFRVEYDERVSLNQVQVHKCLNSAPNPLVASTLLDHSSPASVAVASGQPLQRSLAYEGFRHEATCYTYKGPKEISTYTQETGPIKYDETHRRFKKVMLALIRRIQEVTRLGRPSYLQCYFQAGVAMPGVPNPTVASEARMDTTITAESTSLNPVPQPGELRRTPWFFLFADALEVCTKQSNGDKSEAPTNRVLNAALKAPIPEPGHLLDVATQMGEALQSNKPNSTASFISPVTGPKLLYQKNTTGETILPGIHSYTPLVLNSSATVDRTTCVKCKTKFKKSNQGQLVMLKALLLKWVPNRLYEYPEEFFADVLGVDENPMKANWHRSTVNCCQECLNEIRALKTIPNRTQLAPWLASIAVGGGNEIPEVNLENPQVLHGTALEGASVIVPVPEKSASGPSGSASALPSLLPYLARAPILHTSGPGHASELIPSVAFVAKKHVSLLETQGVIGPQSGLQLNPRIENEGNRGGLTASHPAIRSKNPHSLAHAVSVPNLARSDADVGGGDPLFAKGHTVRKGGVFTMESAYMDETELNPHSHPTHQLTVPVFSAGMDPVRKGFALSKLQVGHSSGRNSPARSNRKQMSHSESVPVLPGKMIIAQKSSIAGGAGTAPAIPHAPLAPTVLISPVKATPTKSVRAWSASSQKNSSGTKLPKLSPAHSPSSTQQTPINKKVAAPVPTPTTLPRKISGVSSSTPSPTPDVSKPPVTSTVKPTSAKNNLPVLKPVALTPGEVEDDYVSEDFESSQIEVATKPPVARTASISRASSISKPPPPAVDESIPDSTEPEAPKSNSPRITDQCWWDEVKQEWSYEPYDPIKLGYTPVIYDPNNYGSPTNASQTAASSSVAAASNPVPDQPLEDDYEQDTIEEETVADTTEKPTTHTTPAAPVVSPPAPVSNEVAEEEEEVYEDDFYSTLP